MDTGARRATILIVDDEPDLIETLGLALTDEGYRVVAAPSAVPGLVASM